MLAVYVFSGGDTATSVLNAVATLTNGSTATFTTALSIAGIFSVCGGAIAYVRSRNILTWLYWFALYLGITAIGLGTKTSVEVIDATNPMQVTTVDHVPIGIALPASEATSISYGLTKAIDGIFHLPDDLGYSSTGMLFGSKQMITSSLVTIQNVQNRFLWNQYYRQCMVPDVVLNGKYSWMQLMETNNLIGFLGGIPQSTLRGIYDGSGKFLTCQQTYQQIKTNVANEVKTQAMPALAEKLFGGKNAQQAQTRLSETLPGSYQYYTGLSASAESILEQNMLINATKNASQNYGAEVGATAGMENYSISKQENTMMLANENSAAQAAYYLPMLQTVLFLLLCATFPLVVMLAMQPYFGVRVILSYLGGFIYLGSWPIFYAILNYIMTTSLYYGTKGMASHGFTLSNASQLAYDHAQAAGIAGYLELSIPVLSLMMVRGMGSVMSQAAQYLFGMAHSVAGQLANEAASGNISLANTSMDNQNWNNIAANKHDVNFTAMQGAGTRQTLYNTTVSHTPLDQEIYNTSGGISQLPLGLIAQQQLSSAISHAYQTQQSHLHQTQTALSTTQSAILNELEQFSSGHSKNDVYGHGASLTDVTKTATAINEMNTAVHNYALTNHCSAREALQHLITGRAGIKGSVNTGAHIIGTKTGIGLEGSLSLDKSRIHNHDYHHDRNMQVGHNHSIQQAFNKGMDSLSTETTNHHVDQSHTQTVGTLNQLVNNFHRAESLSNMVSELSSQTQSLQHLYQQSQQDSVQFNQTAIPAFVNFVKTHTSSAEAEALLTHPTEQNIEQLSQLAGNFIASPQGKQLMGQMQQQVQDTSPISASLGQQGGATQQQLLMQQGQSTIAQQYHQGTQQVDHLDQASGDTYSPLKAVLMEKLTEGLQHVSHHDMEKKQEQLATASQGIDQQVKTEMKKTQSEL